MQAYDALTLAGTLSISSSGVLAVLSALAYRRLEIRSAKDDLAGIRRESARAAAGAGSWAARPIDERGEIAHGSIEPATGDRIDKDEELDAPTGEMCLDGADERTTVLGPSFVLVRTVMVTGTEDVM